MTLSLKKLAESMTIPMTSSEIAGRKTSKLSPMINANSEQAKKPMVGYLDHCLGDFLRSQRHRDTRK